MLTKIREDGKHASLEGGRGITQSKRHPTVRKSTIRISKSGFLLITWMDGNLQNPKYPLSNKRIHAQPIVPRFDQGKGEGNDPSGWRH